MIQTLYQLVGNSEGTSIGDMTNYGQSDLGTAFNGVTTGNYLTGTGKNPLGGSCYIGKDWGSDEKKLITKAVAIGSSDQATGCAGRRGSKSTLSSIIANYEIYKIVKRGDPQAYYGFPAGQQICITSVATSDGFSYAVRRENA